MKKSFNIFKQLVVVALMASLPVFNACEEKAFSEDYDVPWPIPSISGVTPAEALIESEVVITGLNLDKTNRVTIGTAEAEIVSASATQLVIKVPRLASSDKIKISTSFKREAVSDVKFIAIYPKTKVTEWPAYIIPGRTITIKGENVDLITKISVADQDIAVDGSKGMPGEIVVSLAHVNLDALESAVIKIESSKGGVDGAESSPEVPVQEPSTIFVPKPAVVVFDFETNAHSFVPVGDLAPVPAIDGGSLPNARGAHYFSLTAANVSSWKDVGYMEIAEPVDISDFTAPHISFLVNTNGHAGYFQLEDGQGNWYHFKKDPDNYMFTTDGWEWRSYNLEQVDDGKPLDLANLKAKLMFKTGNIGEGTFEIHLDQVMFTDGPVNIQKTLFDFEDGLNTYAGSGSASIANGGPAGDKYLSVTKGSVAKYEWTGDIAVYESMDLSALNDPHICFWINTGTNYGNLQIEVTQDGTKWGSDPFSGEQNDLGGYAVRTDGEWKLYCFRMSELLTSKWGGSGTAFNPKGVIDYVKFGFSSGNIENAPYEVNIDNIVISDGPVF